MSCEKCKGKLIKEKKKSKIAKRDWRLIGQAYHPIKDFENCYGTSRFSAELTYIAKTTKKYVFPTTAYLNPHPSFLCSGTYSFYYTLELELKS